MARTISANSATGITLTNVGDNPVSIDPGVIVSDSAGAALSSTAAYYWSISNGAGANLAGYGFGVSFANAATVINHGTISGAKTVGAGYLYTGTPSTFAILSTALLIGGGGVSNAAGGVIAGGFGGVGLAGAGTVVNAGSIGNSVAAQGFGVALAVGGGVTNQTGGAITAGRYGILSILGPLSVTNQAGATISAGRRGILVTAGAGSVSNLGTIGGATTSGIDLSASGGVTNATIASITGGLYGVRIRGGLGTVSNQGTIAGTATAGVYLANGGSVGNLTGGSIASGRTGVSVKGAAGTVTNQGSVNGNSKYGVYLGAGGTVTNQSGGTISGGYDGVLATNILAAVTNLGVVKGTSAFTTQTFGFGGVVLLGGGSVTNGNNATITGGRYGVWVTTAAGTVSNQGSISTARASLGSAILLQAGGSVSNSPAGTINSSGYTVRIANGAGNVTNDGSIGSAEAAFGGGVLLTSGGSLTNSSTGRIASNGYSVLITGGAGTIVNAGTIISAQTSAGAGAVLISGGSLTNASGAFITGEWIGVQSGPFGQSSSAPAVTIDNAGTIQAAQGNGNGAALWVHGPGVIINRASGGIGTAVNGTISGGPLNGLVNGGFGVVAYYQTTLINYGVIGGVKYSSAGYHFGAVGPKQFAFDASNKSPTNTISNLIEIAPGSSFGGVVKGANGLGSSTLELLSGASTGSVVSFGKVTVSGSYYNGYLGFGAVRLDNGARWKLGGTVAAADTVGFASNGTGQLTLNNPTAMQGTITGFGAGETLTLAGVTAASGAVLGAGNVVTVGLTGGGSVSLQFDPAQSFNGVAFSAALVNGSTDITVSCFAAGTLIRTENGPVAVEHLAEGMRAATWGGDAAEIVWIGKRAIDCSRHPDPAAVCPVRVMAGAFGPSLPSRDLWLSPDHAVFVDGVLIPIHCLINGGTIRQMAVPQVTYYHVELPEHAVILAEDLPVESYLDTGDRANFSNGGGPVRLHADFSARMWEMAGCAPLLVTGVTVERVKRRLTKASTSRTNWARLTNRYTYY